MVSVTQRLRESQARARAERSRQVQLQRNLQSQQRQLRGQQPIQKLQAPLPPSPEQIAEKEYKKQYAETISTLEKERQGYSDRLTKLEKEKVELIAQKEREGTLGGDTMSAITRKYSDLTRPLRAKVQGYNVTIQLAKTKKVADLTQLRGYALQSADISLQQKEAQVQYTKKLREYKERKVEETKPVTDFTKQQTEMYQKQGFSKSEAAFLAEKKMSIAPVEARKLLEQVRVQALFSPTVTAPKTIWEEGVEMKRAEVPTEFRDVVQQPRDLDIGGFGKDLKISETKDVYGFAGIIDNDTGSAGQCYVEASGTLINILRVDVAAFSTATDTTYIRGQITFEIN